MDYTTYLAQRAEGLRPSDLARMKHDQAPSFSLDWQTDRRGNEVAFVEQDGFQVKLTLERDEAPDVSHYGTFAWQQSKRYRWDDLPEESFGLPTGYEQRHEGYYALRTESRTPCWIRTEATEDELYREWRDEKLGKTAARDRARQSVALLVKRLRDYDRDEWTMQDICAVVSLNGVELHREYLGGLESDDASGILEAAQDTMAQAIAEARGVLASLVQAAPSVAGEVA